MKRFAFVLAAVLIPAWFSSCEKIEKTEEKVSVESVKLDQSRLDLTVGETKSLTATVSPYHATDKKVNWASSAPEVASVN